MIQLQVNKLMTQQTLYMVDIIRGSEHKNHRLYRILQIQTLQYKDFNRPAKTHRLEHTE